MSKLFSSGEIIKVLEKHKFLFVSQKGSHGKWKNNHGRSVIIPMNRKEIPYGTFNSIVKQSGLDIGVFLKTH
jgi:predicted RNA binding protein YcfA (HicA-like mRNA interferase family)